MRPDIKEEDVKEIYNRCEEHRRLWNETEIIFNSNYSIGEIFFQVNENQIAKDLIGAVIQKFPQKLNAQRTAKGPISISECCLDGEYIIIENTSKRHDVNMTNWVLTHCVGSVRKVSFKFPENFVLKSKQNCKLWASCRNSSKINKGGSSFSSPSSQNSSSSSLSSKSANLNGNLTTNGFYLSPSNGSSANTITQTNGSPAKTTVNSIVANGTNGTNGTNGSDIVYADSIENELIIYDIENWTCGSQEMFIRLENEFGEEKAYFRKTS